jgi:hypothetical protein
MNIELLIIDSHEMWREILRDHLKSLGEGFNIIEATNGQLSNGRFIYLHYYPECIVSSS